MKKIITIALILLQTSIYCQSIDTTAVGNQFNLKLSDSINFHTGSTEVITLRLPTTEELEKQFWDREKYKLLKLIEEFIKDETTEEKTLIGFYYWLLKNNDY